MKVVIDKYMLTFPAQIFILGEYDIRHLGQCYTDGSGAKPCNE